MEHRWARRTKKAHKVTLYHYKNPVAICKTRDVASEGLFVECSAPVFKNNTPIEVEFEVADEKRRRYRLGAMVAHISDEGIGLYICEYESEAALAWRAMVNKVVTSKSAEKPVATPMAVFASS